MYCIKCGKQISDKSKFCGFCGSQVETFDGAPRFTPPVSQFVVTNNLPKTDLKKDTDIKTEISKNIPIIAIPIIYLLLQIVRMIFGYYEVALIVGNILYGAVFGAFVVAAKHNSKKFQLVYFIPLAIVEIYYLLVYLSYSASFVIYSIVDFLEIATLIALAFVLQKTPLGKDDTMKNALIISGIVSVAGFIVFPFIYGLLTRLLFGGWGGMNFITSIISIAGALAATAFAQYRILKNKR